MVEKTIHSEWFKGCFTLVVVVADMQSVSPLHGSGRAGELHARGLLI